MPCINLQLGMENIFQFIRLARQDWINLFIYLIPKYTKSLKLDRNCVVYQ